MARKRIQPRARSKPRGPDELRAALVSREWSQHKIADQLGVSKATVSRWLSGDRVPDRAHMVALRELLEINPEAWL